MNWLKRFFAGSIVKSFIRNLGTRVLAWLTIIGIAPDVATAWWSTTALILVSLAEYLLAQYFSVKNAVK